jgi:cysteinyl-tRNA synthetase
MQVQLYDTLSRGKKPLRAPEPGKPITMYLCGPTVYGRAHIGNARGPVVFDVLYRLLRHLHGAENVRYARNITDIDDKIMAKAVAENRSPQAVAREFEAAYFEDMGALGCLMPDFNPRATEHIAGAHGMVAMIEALIARGVAYAADGHVLFEVSKFDSYGALSKRPMDEMIAGARVEVAPYKRAPGDFVLWKPSTPDQPGWESPWGRGRPGWHIECSAMIRGVLQSDTIDIHGGGIDLQFPHHENERAQSCCAHEGAELANIWMHNGFLTMGETKMSKSIGNIITPRELLDAGWQGEVLRLALLSAHYRQPLRWTDDLLAQSKGFLDRWYRRKAAGAIAEADLPIDLLDDLNVPEVMKVFPSGKGILGLGGIDADDWLKRRKHVQAIGGSVGIRAGTAQVTLGDEDVDRRIKSYEGARAHKDWPAADAIRDELKAEGIEISVAKDGKANWRRA